MVGVRDLFRVGIGPSSSHTVGPMKAAAAFAGSIAGREVARVRCDLLGSLAWTGAGHASDRAVMLGLAGLSPESICPDEVGGLIAGVQATGKLTVNGRPLPFDPASDIAFDREAPTPVHPNTLVLSAFDAGGERIEVQRWCSIGGGFIAREHLVGVEVATERSALPYPFATAAELLATCARTGMDMADVMRANEAAAHPGDDLDVYLDRIALVMLASIDRGIATRGVLPGRLGVARRAPDLAQRLADGARRNLRSPHAVLDHVSVFAIAVNEENAAGGRVVTAPTNGAAGVVPAVLRYYRDFWPEADGDGERKFLLTAAAIGSLIKRNASISGAEVGCQGEVGTASSMAAAGLTAALEGTPRQVENAAEIAMEHHLGMTCDPIAGLVQVPCIERNAFGAVKAINAASLALAGNGDHLVHFDQVIETMFRTGKDMHAKYKETSQGGLAVNFPEC